jgi:hypothetical protein
VNGTPFDVTNRSIDAGIDMGHLPGGALDNLGPERAGVKPESRFPLEPVRKQSCH